MLRPLTALRFVFALMVFLAHCVFFIPGGEAAHPAVFSLFYEGFIGVSFFFILSGFILAYRYAGSIRTDAVGVKTFWLRRWTRIYPPYLFCLLLSAGLHFQYLQREPANWARDLGLHLTMLQTIVAGGKHAFMFNGPAWSVADEMVFYLLFPLVIGIAARPRIWRPLLAIAVAAVVTSMIRSSGPPQSDIFYSNPFVRLVDFLLGVALFQIYRCGKSSSWSRVKGTTWEITTILLLISFLLLRNHVPLFWRYSVYYWIPMLLLIYVFAKGAGHIAAFLSRPVPVLLGEASYSFYLFHTPAAMLLSIGFRRLGLTPGAEVFIGSYFVFSLCGSLLLFRYLERPATRVLRQHFIDRPPHSSS